MCYIERKPKNKTRLVVWHTFRSIVKASFEETSITVEFDEIYLINEFKLEAWGVAVNPGKIGDPFCYVVDVSRDDLQ